MNFIFISPHFPKHYWQFCARLKKNGVNVLGIGDAPYETLREELKRDLTEYYYLPTLEDYDAVLRAVAYLEFKHGKIDWLESNSEYLLELDARLRTDFNITTGFQASDISRIKSKSAMKNFYAKAGVGEVGDFVGLEVNMRPAGALAPELMNFAHSTDVYGRKIVLCERLPEREAVMGNQAFVAKFLTQEAVEEFINFVQERKS